MRSIITVSEFPSMPGRYNVSSDGQKSRAGIARPADVSGEHAAAAKAMELALKAGIRGYVVFAPKKVLDLIPKDMQSRDVPHPR